MLDLVLVCGGEVGAHAPVVAGDDDGASAGGHVVVDAVDGVEADLLVGLDEHIGVLVLSNAADEDDRVLGQHVLCASGSVLGGTTGVEVGLVVGQEVIVDAQVLVLGENGIVGLESVLVEQGLVTAPSSVFENKVNNPFARTRRPGCRGEGSPSKEVRIFPSWLVVCWYDEKGKSVGAEVMMFSMPQQLQNNRKAPLFGGAMPSLCC